MVRRQLSKVCYAVINNDRLRLFEQFDTVVLTSATLTVGNRFDYIRQRLGLDNAKERTLPPEFHYGEQALFYLPQRMPDVRNAGFASRAADEVSDATPSAGAAVGLGTDRAATRPDTSTTTSVRDDAAVRRARVRSYPL